VGNVLDPARQVVTVTIEGKGEMIRCSRHRRAGTFEVLVGALDGPDQAVFLGSRR